MIRITSLCTALLLSACATADETADSGLPPGAIEVREGYYMVPVGEDDTGCMMYTPHAPGRMTDQAIRFRRADGSFTTSRDEADCVPPSR